ncbi:MAG: dienelactone hydrolase family protein [Muribaculaceae bacterium]|nr:dienelactone hydrolase family protein [Muribaculaceae bacterium]
MLRKLMISAAVASLPLFIASASTTWEDVNVNGSTRKIKLHVPDDTPAGASLVIACHGMNQSADWHDGNSKWTAVSDTAKFVLVFPEGIDHGWDISGNRDVDFVCAIIDKMEKEQNINPGRVYLTGFSMGGMFTYHCANRISDKIAAFVPVSGYPMWDKSAYSTRPVPIMHVHGTGDDVCVYSGVQPTLDNWIKRNQCNATPEVIAPYPQGNPNRGATMYRWTDGLDGVEVHLLELQGKGHWQSEDPVYCLTSIEAWNFMKRWSLGPDAPKVETLEPETGSFDLPVDGMDISLTFDMNVESEGVEAYLEGEGGSVALTPSCSGNVLTLAVPAIAPGEYRLQVKNVKGENEGLMKVFRATYVFGVEEVGDVPPYNVIFHPDLRAEQNTVGEGIPTGWHRINSRANGDKDEKGSGSPNTGGARMKYFLEGGDFNEGFYLSARDYDRCDITYGKYPEYPLHFEKGKYVATLNSAFWNEGSMNGDVKFDFHIKNLAGTPVAAFSSLPSRYNLGEQAGRIEDSMSHRCEFEIPEEGDYLAVYSMTSGWSAVIVGNLKIETAMSQAERYKGTFLRTLNRAKALYESIPEENLSDAGAENLLQVISKYESLVSTSPSVYENATAELAEAIERASGLSSVMTVKADVVSEEYVDLLGRRVKAGAEGILVRRTLYKDGHVEAVLVR